MITKYPNINTAKAEITKLINQIKAEYSQTNYAQLIKRAESQFSRYFWGSDERESEFRFPYSADLESIVLDFRKCIGHSVLMTVSSSSEYREHYVKLIPMKSNIVSITHSYLKLFMEKNKDLFNNQVHPAYNSFVMWGDNSKLESRLARILNLFNVKFDKMNDEINGNAKVTFVLKTDSQSPYFTSL